DHGYADLSPLRIGHAHDNGLGHLGVGEEELFDLSRVHVRSAGDVHIGFATGEEQVSALVEVADVAGVEEPACEGFGVRIGPSQVAGAHGGTGHAGPSGDAGGGLDTGVVTDDDLDSGASAAAGADAGGVDGDPTVILGPEDRDRSGHLGETEILNEAATESLERAGLVGG